QRPHRADGAAHVSPAPPSELRRAAPAILRVSREPARLSPKIGPAKNSTEKGHDGNKRSSRLPFSRLGAPVFMVRGAACGMADCLKKCLEWHKAWASPVLLLPRSAPVSRCVAPRAAWRSPPGIRRERQQTFSSTKGFAGSGVRSRCSVSAAERDGGLVRRGA